MTNWGRRAIATTLWAKKVVEIENAFLLANPHLKVPSLCVDACAVTSTEFASVLNVAGINAEVIHGFMFEEWNGHKVIISGHAAVKVTVYLDGAPTGEAIIFDWTARQFDPDAPVPKVWWSVKEFRQEWHSLNDLKSKRPSKQIAES